MTAVNVAASKSRREGKRDGKGRGGGVNNIFLLLLEIAAAGGRLYLLEL